MRHSCRLGIAKPMKFPTEDSAVGLIWNVLDGRRAISAADLDPGAVLGGTGEEHIQGPQISLAGVGKCHSPPQWTDACLRMLFTALQQLLHQMPSMLRRWS